MNDISLSTFRIGALRRQSDAIELLNELIKDLPHLGYDTILNELQTIKDVIINGKK